MMKTIIISAGIFTLAAVLQALVIDVTMLVDRRGYELNMHIMKKQVEAGTFVWFVWPLSCCSRLSGFRTTVSTD